MTKNKFYKDFTKTDLDFGYDFMQKELKENSDPEWLHELFNYAWKMFENGQFSYDGATFVGEISDETIFEVASFIHDFLNALGYVCREVDELFVEIMVILNYPAKMIMKRSQLMFFTPINVLIHKYIRKNLKENFDLQILLHDAKFEI